MRKCNEEEWVDNLEKAFKETGSLLSGIGGLCWWEEKNWLVNMRQEADGMSWVDTVIFFNKLKLKWLHTID